VRGDVAVASSEIPYWVNKGWLERQFNTFPVVSIKLDKVQNPEYVLYQWYLKGVAIPVCSDSKARSLGFDLFHDRFRNSPYAGSDYP